MKSRLNIKKALKKYCKVEIDLLLAHVLKKSREFLFMNPAHRLTRIQQNRFTRMIKRREKGEPVAYILGYKDFMGYRFKVNRDVLIPRPETEWLVERVLSVIPEFAAGRYPESRKTDSRFRGNDRLKIKDDELKILDLGTGSGCIAISIAKILKANSYKLKADFYASDISKKALKIARTNAKTHKVKIKFIHSDILKNLRMKFDIIVANLPYVPKKIYNLKFEDLKFEPKNALVDPNKDFNLYERFFKQLASLPFLPKAVFLEIDPSQKLFLSQTAKKYLPGADIKFYRDFNNFWRYAEIVV